MKGQLYDINVQTYTQSIQVTVVENCNAITFTNTGDTVVTINCGGQMVLYPGTVGSILGDSRSIGGNEGEIFKGRISLQFANPAGAAPAVEIIQKFYVDPIK